jgi:ABC-type lipoprotein release transport system permease subunit
VIIPLKYSLRNLAVRKTSSLMTMGGMALVVVVFCLLLSMAHGLALTLMETAEPDNMVVLRSGAIAESNSTIRRDQWNVLRLLPDIKRDETGQPLASPELLLQLMLPKKGGGKANLQLRGIEPVAFKVHRRVGLVEGRFFESGLAEVIVGQAAFRRFMGLSLGERVKFGQREWTVVGIFEAGGTALESEIWSDLTVLMGDYRREVFSSVTLTATHPDRIPDLIRPIAENPTIALHALSESDYYREQSQWAEELKGLGFMVALFMSFGAILGAMMTMYATVAHRVGEIAVLRAIGFSRGSVLLAFTTESLILSSVGGFIGCLVALPFNGLSTGILNMRNFSEVSFAFRITPDILLDGLLFATVMGLLGGILPARQAARLPIVQAIRGS